MGIADLEETGPSYALTLNEWWRFLARLDDVRRPDSMSGAEPFP